MTTSQQLGFGFEALLEEQQSAHLPSEIESGISHYRSMLERHNAAMLNCDEKTAMDIRKEANRLAVKLNGGAASILGGPDAPGYVLMDSTAAPTGTIPIWGQQGQFEIKVGDMAVRIEMDGMLGICQSMSIWPGFSANVVNPDKPFLSETGYRSFLGVHADLVPGLTPETFAREAVDSYIKAECKGKLKPLEKQYRERLKAELTGTKAHETVR